MTEAARILVVDDDVEIRRLLCDYLQTNGLRAEAASDAAQARRAHRRERADLIVLDLMMPGESGLDLCRDLRRDDTVPIIMLTALSEETDRIVGLEVGADDYVPKPFSPRELLGRIRAVLRRTLGAANTESTSDFRKFRFAGWQLDSLARALTAHDGSESRLTAADCQVLQALLAERGQTVSRARLFEDLHNREFDPLDRSIDVRISRLRQLLGDDARAPQIIKTVHGKGYAIGVDVETV